MPDTFATILVVDQATGQAKGFLTQEPSESGVWKIVQTSKDAGKWRIGKELDNAMRRFHRYIQNRYQKVPPKVALRQRSISV